MILELITNNSRLNSQELIYSVLMIIICTIIAIIIHEFGRNFIINRIEEAKNLKIKNKLFSLNNLITVFLMLIFGSAWNNPVSKSSLDKNQKGRIAIGGLTVSLIFSFIIVFLGEIFVLFISTFLSDAPEIIQNVGMSFFETLAVVNISLLIFNILPVPPLDGSKIIGMAMNEDLYDKYMSLEKYSLFFLVIILIFICRMQIIPEFDLSNEAETYVTTPYTVNNFMIGHILFAFKWISQLFTGLFI